MSTVFVGGSRHMTRLPARARERLDNVVRSGFKVVVGDANGADKAAQKYLWDAKYDKVTVFYSGSALRNNVGSWPTRAIAPPKAAKGFQFYAAKDREMAAEADFGLMFWDGKSPGTLLNVLRLLRAGKKAVLIDAAHDATLNFKTDGDWDRFLLTCGEELQSGLKERATVDEWGPAPKKKQATLFDAEKAETMPPRVDVAIDETFANVINEALASGNTAAVISTLGDIARSQGMSHVAKDAGLARESLYRSLRAEGNPEFATVVKVIESVGLRLSVSKVS